MRLIYYFFSFPIIVLSIIYFSTLDIIGQVNQEWVARYNGPLSINQSEEPSSIVSDNSGNIYVAGKTYSVISNYDYYVVKFNSSGTKIWSRTYDDPWGLNDYAVGIAVDQAGNVFVTGVSENSGGAESDDFLTIKYNSNGDTMWTRRYNGPGNDFDDPLGVAIDINGYILVAGESYDLGYGYAVIKYDQNGNLIWTERNSSPPLAF